MAAKHPPTDATSVSDAGDGDGKVRDLTRHRRSIESTLPPTPLKDLLAAGGATVYVLSTDDALLETVYRAGGEQYPIYAVRNWTELDAAVATGRCNIALLDADHLGPHLARKLVELERYGSRLVTLVAASREDSQALIGYLSERKIHRLLIKPAALGITRLLLESAVARALQLRGQPAEPEPLFPNDRRGRPPERTVGGGRLPAWMLATGLLSLTIAALVTGGLTRSLWEPLLPGDEPAPVERAPERAREARAPDLGTSEDAPDPLSAGAAETRSVEPSAAEGAPQGPASAPPAASAVDTVPQATDAYAGLLASAADAVAQGRLAEPPDDNALEYYRTVLAAAPDHPAARAGLDAVLEALFTDAERALLDDDLGAAAAALAHVRRAEPASARLAFLEAQLERARADRTAPARARTAPVVPSAASAAVPAGSAGELESLLTLAATRIAREQLVEPAGDSAREYLDRAAALAPGDPRVAEARAELAEAMIAAANEAVARDDLERAASLRAAALGQGADPSALDSLEQAIRAAEQRYAAERQLMLLQLARERLANGDLVSPNEDNALHYLSMLRAENPSHPGLPAEWAELERSLEANARMAFRAGSWTDAATWLDAWRRVAPASPAASALAEELAVARRQEEFLATAAPASELRLIEYEPPAYPQSALRDGTEGSVTLEFVVGTDGRPREIVVAEAEPPGRFEEAAVAAVRDYVYEPYTLDGRTYERRIRLRLSFTLR